MKIKAVRKNKWWVDQDYITIGDEYKVVWGGDDGRAFDIVDDNGDSIYVFLTGSAHGFDFEVVQEYPDPMPIVEPEEDLMETDNVNNPSHYGTGNIECIDYIKDFLTNEEYVGYLRGNVAKYLHRFRYKNGSEDLKKAEWYLKELIEAYEDKQ